ncbi:MAG: IS200/IS605 family transposase [Bacteroidales bacterium]
MANTYTQINIHAVFAVKGHQNQITKNFRSELFKYISGIVKNQGLFPLAVNGWLDHVHVFFELKPDVSISKVIELIKANSSKWINENKFIKGKFEWQRGYGAFSYSRSQRSEVINYIANQEAHHKPKENTFKKEYLGMLNRFEVDYDPKYLFEFFEELFDGE